MGTPSTGKKQEKLTIILRDGPGSELTLTGGPFGWDWQSDEPTIYIDENGKCIAQIDKKNVIGVVLT